MKKKVILAYSGGLDTSCCIAWLKEQGYEVICFSAYLGEEFSPSQLRKRALRSGASRIYIKDLRREFAYDFILPSLKANAIYEGKYLLSTALARPLIAKYLVEYARREKARFVAHGCSAKGNDQVRFEVTLRLLEPRLKIIAPLREWDLSSREEEIEYARKKKIPIKVTKSKPYSMDRNIWGASIEAGVLEDLNQEPPSHIFFLTQAPQMASPEPQYVSIEFNRGLPVKVDGRRFNLVALIELLNRTGGRHSIGRTDLIEDRVVGIKSREIYEAPGAWILYVAHKELESLILDRETLFFKEMVSLKYGQLVYQGLWFSSFKEALDAFIQKTQERITGLVTLKLYRGNITPAKRISKYALYKKELVSYGERDIFDRSLAKGFIELFFLPYRLKR